jgi:hypothetical protein
MSFNTSHHAEMEIPHSDGHSHDHGPGHTGGHHDDHGSTSPESSHHAEATDSHTGGNEDDCCSDDIAKLLQEEKNIVKSLTLDHPVFTYFIFAPFSHIGVSFHNSVNRDKKYFVRNYHPPISDIRIAIQSFQI